MECQSSLGYLEFGEKHLVSRWVADCVGGWLGKVGREVGGLLN